MNWIKQNKFEAILLIVVIVAAVGIILFGVSSGKAYNEAKDRFDSAEASVSSMESGKPYPDPANVKERQREVAAFREEVADLQKSLLTFRPATLEKISPAEFGTRLTETSDKLRGMYEKQGITFPDEWRAGFESYTTGTAKDAATPYLAYQLQAMEAIFTDLANAQPGALLNVYRGRLPVEDGRSMDGDDDQSSRRGRSSRGRGRGAPESDKPFHVMPVEITFRGRESSVRQFLSSLAGAENYFTSIRSVRVRNAKTVAPKISDAEFEGGLDTGEGGDDGSAFDNFDALFGGDDGGDDAEEEEAVEEEEAAGSDQILGQVLGAEELDVFVQLELLLFKDEVELPEVSN